MLGKWRAAGAAITLVLCSAAGALAQSAPEARAFRPEFWEVKISPDGERVATIRPYQDRNAIVVYRFDEPPGAGGEPTLVIPSGEGLNITGLDWVGDRRLFIYTGFAHQNVDNYRQIDEEAYGNHWQSLDISTGQLVAYTPPEESWIVSLLPNDPDHVLIETWYSGYWRPATMQLDTGALDYLERGPQRGASFNVDQRYRPRLSVAWQGNDYTINWREPGSTQWHEVYRGPQIDNNDTWPIAMMAEGEQEYIYVRSRHEGRGGIYRIPTTGGGMERIYLNDRFDTNGLDFRLSSGTLYYASYIDDVYERHYLRDRTAEFDAQHNEQLPGDYAYWVDSSRDGNRHVIWTFSAGRPDTYWLYDRDARSYALFAPSFLGLEQAPLANVRSVSYRARDGLTIPGYLTVPPGMEDGPQPLIVFPHGGPLGIRTNAMFDPWRQYLATRGYLVFEPNYRGSGGYGADFQNRGGGGWGTTMPQDVIDGVEQMIAQGIADPDRICVVGGSYGGYLAMYLPILRPDLFQCAVAANGVYDLVEFTDSFGHGADRGQRRDILRDRFGDAARDAAALRQMSPTHRAGEITVPSLVIAAEEDDVVPFSQTEDLIEAMQEAGRAPETLLFEEGDHSMGTGTSYVRTLERIGEFLGEHLN